MSTDRYVVIGLARVRAPWFGEVARWAHAAALPIEFVKCISPAEAHARLAGGRAISAMVVDAGASGIDRDLIDLARRTGVATIVVDDPRIERDWVALGAAAVLPDHFERADLIAVLAQHASPIRSHVAANAAELVERGADERSTWQGRTIAVCGGGGTGSSTMAMATAQSLASMPANRGSVVLADLALRADLAMYHDAGDVVPGLQELIEAHHNGRPSAASIRRMLFDIESRHYLLLLGLRRSRDWTALRPRALDAALASLASGFRYVVADIDADVEGDDATGSVDVEERNGAARSAALVADVCVIVSLPTLKGMHDAVRITGDLHELGVDPERILHVVNRAARSPRGRSEITAALAALLGTRSSSTAPIFIGERRGLELAHRAGGALPTSLGAPIAAASMAVIRRLGEQPRAESFVPAGPAGRSAPIERRTAS